MQDTEISTITAGSGATCSAVLMRWASASDADRALPGMTAHGTVILHSSDCQRPAFVHAELTHRLQGALRTTE